MKDKNKLFLDEIDPIKEQLPLNYQKLKLVFDSTNSSSDKIILKSVESTAFGSSEMGTTSRPKWTSRTIQFPDVN